MAECPLRDGEMVWDRDIPDECRRSCESLWITASQGAPDNVDVFDPDCDHAVESGGESLQKAVQPGMRAYAVLQICMKTEDDAFADEYSFRCANS